MLCRAFPRAAIDRRHSLVARMALTIAIVAAVICAPSIAPSVATAATKANSKLASGKTKAKSVAATRLRRKATAVAGRTPAGAKTHARSRATARPQKPANLRTASKKLTASKQTQSLSRRLKGRPPLLAFARLPTLKPVKLRRPFRAAKPARELLRLRQASLIVPKVRLPRTGLPDDSEDGVAETGEEVYLDSPKRRFPLANVSFAFSDRVRLADNVVSVCLPMRLKLLLNEIAATYGEVLVSSAARSPFHNALVGGAPHSLHLDCLAIDFLVDGPREQIYEMLKANAMIGGLSLYRDGHFHIDSGPRRIW